MKKMDSSVIAYNKGVFKRLLLALGVEDVPSLIKHFRTSKSPISSKSTVYDWERGDRIVPQKWLIEVATEKGIPIDWFYRSDEEIKIDLKIIEHRAIRKYLIDQITLLAESYKKDNDEVRVKVENG
jgi:transcriptional regulator with XRE-family HTH domain